MAEALYEIERIKLNRKSIASQRLVKVGHFSKSKKGRVSGMPAGWLAIKQARPDVTDYVIHWTRRQKVGEEWRIT